MSFLAVVHTVLGLPRDGVKKGLYAGDGGFKRWIVQD